MPPLPLDSEMAADVPPTDAPADPRQRLLHAAEEVFARKGFDAASVRDICGRAGANVAAVNYYFGDKENLYVEAVKFAHACSISESDLPDWPAGTPAKTKLEAFIRGMVRSMHGPVRPSSLQLLMRELAHPSPATTAVVREYIRPMAMGLWEIVGEMFPHMDEHRRLMIGFSVVGQCLYYRQNRVVSELLFGTDAVGALDEQKVADHIVTFTLAALGHGPAIADTPKPKARRRS